ncbi:autophagy-related protein 23 [Oryzias melastigma]|uniref:autophagy-related protein 23 n=1 Tax=Oryzias melastigma TaxID=30732 RepID=UPI000CF8109F|nr:autophagy-related protein 23 [Oryzias melastigma]
MSSVNKQTNPKPSTCDVLEGLKKAHKNLIQENRDKSLATKVEALERENARLRKELEEFSLSTNTEGEKDPTNGKDLTRQQAKLDLLWELEECKAHLVQQMDINDKYKTQIKKLKQEAKDLKEKKAGKGGKGPRPGDNEAFDDLKRKYKESQEENEDIKAEFQALVYEVEDFEKEIADLKKKLEVSAQHEATAMELREQLKVALSTETNQLREKKLKEEKDLTNDEDLTRKQAKLDLLWELEECKARLVQQMDINDKNKTQIKKLKQQAKDLKEKKAGKGGKGPRPEDNKAFEDLKRQYKESQEENEDIKAEFQALVYEVEDFEKEIADLNKKLEVSAQHEANAMELREQLKVLENDKGELNRLREKEKEDAQRELQKTLEVSAQLDTTIMELREQLKQHEEEKRALSELNKLREKEAQDAKRELEELRANINKTPRVSRFKESVMDIKCRQDSLMEDITNLENILEEMEKIQSSHDEEMKIVSVQTDSVNQEGIAKEGESTKPQTENLEQTEEKTTGVEKTSSPDTANDGRAEHECEKEEDTPIDGTKKDLLEIQEELSDKDIKSKEEKEEVEVGVKQKKGKKVKRSSFTKFFLRLWCIKYTANDCESDVREQETNTHPTHNNI